MVLARVVQERPYQESAAIIKARLDTKLNKSGRLAHERIGDAVELLQIIKDRLEDNQGKSGPAAHDRIKDAMSLLLDREFVGGECSGDLNYAREYISSRYLGDITTRKDRTLEKLEAAYRCVPVEEWEKLHWNLDDIIEESERRTAAERQSRPEPKRETRRATIEDLEKKKQENEDLTFRFRREQEARETERRRADEAELRAKQQEHDRAIAEAEREASARRLAEIESRVEQLPETVREIVKTQPVEKIKEAALALCPTCGGAGKVLCKK